MTELEGLARKAIEARKAFIESGLPEGSIGHSKLFAAGVQTNTAYHSAATPETILTLIQEKREMEEALKRIDALNDNPSRFSAEINDVIRSALTPGDTP